MTIWKRRVAITSFYVIQILSVSLGIWYNCLWPVLVGPLVLAYSFTALGLITSDFLTPHLAIISKEVLHISDRVSGMTLLALGNSMPDITSTYQSMRSGATPLALGEMLGAMVFLLTVIVGVMPMVRTIELGNLNPDAELDTNTLGRGNTALCYNRNRFLKDLGMFAILISLSLVFLHDGKLVFWECFLMVSIYVVYVLGQLYWERCEQLTDANLLQQEAGETIVTEIETAESEHPRNKPQILQDLELRKANLRAKIRRRLRSSYAINMKMSLNDILNVWDNREIFSSPPAPRLTKSVSHQDFRPTVTVIEPAAPENPGADEENTPREEGALSSGREHGHLKPPLRTSSRSVSADYLLYLDNHLPSGNSSFVDSASSQESLSIESEELIPLISGTLDAQSPEKAIIQSVLHQIWHKETVPFTLLEMLSVLIISPAQFVLRLLISAPTEASRRATKISKWKRVQTFMAPLLVDYLLTDSLQPISGVLAVAVGVSSWYLGRRSSQKWLARFISVLAFIVSVSTISFIVKIVVKVLTLSASMLNISQAMLGLTVFAWGNSVGDLATTITFTKMGVLDVALGACFGGPLLYFLFGVGLNGMLIMSLRSGDPKTSIWFRTIEFEVNTLLIVSCLGILAAFAVYMFMIPLNNWRVDKKIGLVLIGLYCLTTGSNIYLELT